MCDFFKNDEYKKKNMYISTHYFHLLHFLKNENDLKDLFNSHLHQSIIHELFSENDIILLLDSPYFDIHYKYNSKKYEKNLIKSIKNNIYQKNLHLSNIEEAYLLNEKLEKINTPPEPTIKRKKKIYKPIFLHNDLSSESSSSEISENDFILEDYESLSSEDNDFYAFTNPIHNFSSESESESESESDNEHIHQPGILLHHPDEDNYFNQNQSQTGNLNITLVDDVFTDPRDNHAFIYHGRGNIERRYIDENGNRVKELFNINNQNEPIQTIYFSGNINVPQLLETHQKENDESHLIDHISKLNESIDNYKKVGNIENKYDDNQESTRETVEIEKINKKHLFTYFSSSKSTNYKKYEDSNILILACMKKMDKLAYFLLNHFKDIDVNYTNKNGENALLLACENGLFESSKYLLDHKDVQVNIFSNEEGDSKEHLLEICARNKLGVQSLQILDNHQFKKYIIQNRHNIEYNYIVEKALGHASRNNMIIVIQTILENYKLDVSMLNTYNNNPLYWCTMHKNSEAISLLLKYKDIDVSEVKEKNIRMSYLELLCKQGLEKNIFELLKNKKYDLKENNDTKSPFFFACKSGLTNVALKLLELNDYKVKFEVRENKSHKNSLYYACLKNMNNVIKILLNKQDISEDILNIMDMNENTPLILCIKNKNEKRALQILKLKYEKKINVNVYQNNNKKKNALYYAVEHNLKRVIQLLLNDKISYTPTLLKIFSKLSQSENKEKYNKILDTYRNTDKVRENNCNICFDNHYNDSNHNKKEENMDNINYLVKCEFCVGLFHIQCLSTYFKSAHSSKCPYCRKKGNYFLTK